MTDPFPPLESSRSSDLDLVFPTLKPPQIERLVRHGHVRHVEAHEVLVEAGSESSRVFIVKTGQVELVQPSGAIEKPVALLLPGQFTGEISVLSGRHILVRVRAKEESEVIDIDRDHLLTVLQT